MLSTVEVHYVQCWQKKRFFVHIQCIGYVQDNGMHALIHTYLQKNKDKTIPSFTSIYMSLMCLEMEGQIQRQLPWTAIASHKMHASEYDTIISIHDPASI